MRIDDQDYRCVNSVLSFTPPQLALPNQFQQQIPDPGRRKMRFEMKDGQMAFYIARQLPPIMLTKVPQVATTQ